jgi:hypothetical protein
MIRNLLSAGVLSLGMMFVASARADEASHRAAVEKLFAAMNIAEAHKATIDKMLEAQTQANPAMAAMREVIEPFLTKHMGWAALKDDMIKLYAGAFTEQELGEMEKFYQTPVGKKALREMPALTAKAMQAAQSKMQPHMPELQAALKAAAEKKGAPGAAPSSGGTPENFNK